MKKCLVTKLSGQTDNQNLLKIGEMRIYFAKVSGSTPRKITLSFNKDCQVSINGGYFTNNNLSSNIGTTENFTANVEKEIFISNDECYISIADKYSLLKALCNDETMSFDINSIKFSKGLVSLDVAKSNVYGNVSAFQELQEIAGLSLGNSQLYGDISAFDKLISLSSLGISNTKIIGNISSLQKLTKLNALEVNETDVEGDIAALQNMTLLRFINANYAKLSGNISAFNNMSQLSTIFMKANGIIGDISSLPANVELLSSYAENKFTWKNTRPNSSSIISLDNVNLGSDVDSMLINMAKCTAKDVSNKMIKVIGTKTSASDAAVQTLQSKGYTVSVTPA